MNTYIETIRIILLVLLIIQTHRILRRIRPYDKDLKMIEESRDYWTEQFQLKSKEVDQRDLEIMEMEKNRKRIVSMRDDYAKRCNDLYSKNQKLVSILRQNNIAFDRTLDDDDDLPF